jgi:hypothetical protein
MGFRMAARSWPLLVVSVVLWCSAAGAIQQVKSLYTAIDLARCKAAQGGPAHARLCPGLPGYPVYVAEDERSSYLSVGQNAVKRQAARQTLKPFNTLFHGDGQRTTVEWRFVVREQRPVPYATIVRYFTKSASGEGEVLVVTRVTSQEACQVAYVDALANADAMVLARKIADTVARSKPCPAQPAVHGEAGRSPM